MLKIIVVGAGIAGLVSSIRAKKEGFDVIVLEKNNKSGGLVNSFYRDGFLFDGGTRALQGFVFPLLKAIKIDFDYVKTPVSIGIEDKIISIESEKGISDYKNLLQSLYPDSSDDIDKIFVDIKKMGKFLNSVNRILDFNKGIFYFIINFIPNIIKLFFNLGNIIGLKVPIEDYFNKKLNIKNQSLIDIITQHFFKGTPTFFALGYLYLYPDYIYPIGGTGKLAEKLEEKTKELDIKIKYETKIIEVNASEKYIVDENNEKYYYDNLIWTADLKTLYRNLKIDKFSTNIVKKIEKEKEKILNHKGAESIFTIYLAVNQEPEYFKNISNCHLFYTPYRNGLGNINGEEKEFLISNWNNLNKEDIFKWIERYCKYNTFEISIPVLKDNEAAPPKKTGIIISFLFDYEISKRFKESGWYLEMKEKIENQIIDLLSNSIYKGLKDKIIFKFSSTPLTIEEISGTSEGSVIGWSMEKQVPINANLLKMKESAKTSIPYVLKAGQWTMSPAGVPTAILTGNIAIDLLKKTGKRIKNDL